MLRQLVYIYLMSLLPEFVYQGVLPDCFSQITDWFMPLPDLSSLLATNSLFPVFQSVSGSVLSYWTALRCILSLLILWPFTCWYCCFNHILYLCPGSVPFVCHPVDLWQIVLLCFPNLLFSSLTNPEKGILFKWDISALMLNCTRTWELDVGNMELLSVLITLWDCAYNAVLFSYICFSLSCSCQLPSMPVKGKRDRKLRLFSLLRLLHSAAHCR